MLRPRPPLLGAVLALAACSTPPSPAVAPPPTPTTAAVASVNPFFSASALPYEAPPFDRITDADYQPALEEGMRQQRAEIEAIATQTAEPTFDNTLVAMERSGALLGRAQAAFAVMTAANTNATIQSIESAEAPKLSAHHDAIYLDDRLFRRVKSVYDRRESLGLEPDQRKLVEDSYRAFVRAGAQLAEADKVRLRALNQEESRLTTGFRSKILAGTRDAALVVDDRAALAGLSEGDVAAASEAAKQRGVAGKWVLPLQNTTQQPAQASLSDRATRQRLFEASIMRSERGDSNDTRATVQRLAQLRTERANLLGFPTFADYKLDNQMAKTPAAAIKLMTGMVPAATAKARGEAARMQRLIDAQKGGFKLAAWDWQYYAEQVRKAEYDLDESQTKPYFLLDRVLQDGVFYAANQLYGITFKERKDIPVYHPDVRVFEVFDADGRPMALFYCDYFKRDNKRGGAWMSNFVEQSTLLGQRPVVYNVANFTKPAPGQPALLTFSDVTTMFHEFGHALHGMFAASRYPTLSGTSVSRDFVEFPSQFNEHWALEPRVFANYAKHYQTGAAMPAALVDKIRRVGTFNQGYATTEYLGAALLDMAWHALPANTPLQDVDAFESAALAKFGVDLPEVPPRYRSSYFSHIWGSGYSAGYYAYLWAEVLDHDAYSWFVEHGGMTRENGQRFRDMVLSRGSTVDEATLFRNFRGRDPSVEPLLVQRGLKDVKTDK